MYFCMTGSAITILLEIIAMQYPQHSVMYSSLFTAGLPVISIHTYLKTARVDMKSTVGGGLCWAIMNAHGRMKGIGKDKRKEGVEKCQELDGEHSMWHLKETFCNIEHSLPTSMFANACSAYRLAYWGLTAQLIIVIINFILQILANGFTYYYYHQSQKAKYREIGWVMYIVAPVLLLVGCVLEFIFLMMLNNPVGDGFASLVLKTHNGFGHSDGYIILVFTCILQCIIPCVYVIVKSKAEHFLKEQKEKRKFEAEMMAMHGDAYGEDTFDAYGQGFHDPYAQPQSYMGAYGGYGYNQSYAQPQSGYGAQGYDPRVSYQSSMPGYDPRQSAMVGAQPGYDPRQSAMPGYGQHPQSGYGY